MDKTGIQQLGYYFIKLITSNYWRKPMVLGTVVECAGTHFDSFQFQIFTQKLVLFELTKSYKYDRCNSFVVTFP